MVPALILIMGCPDRETVGLKYMYLEAFTVYSPSIFSTRMPNPFPAVNL